MSKKGVGWYLRIPLMASRIAAQHLLVASIAQAINILALFLRKKPAPRSKDDVQRILVIRLDSIGDVVMTLPSLRALRQAFPGARIDILVQEYIREVFDGCPWIDDAIGFSLKRTVTAQTAKSSGLSEWVALVKQLNAAGYDLAIDLRGDNYARSLMKLSGAPVRVGFGRSSAETSSVPSLRSLLTSVAQADPTRSWVEENLAVVSAAMAAFSQPAARYQPAGWEFPAAGRALGKRRRLGVDRAYCVVHVRSSLPAKEWGDDEWARVIDRLCAAGLAVILTGSEHDRDKTSAVRGKAAMPERVFNASGEFTLSELFPLIAGARLAVTVDTAPAHIAALTGAPCIDLILPYYRAQFSPYGQADRALVAPTDMPFERFSLHRYDRECRPLLSIRPETVIAAIDSLLADATAQPQAARAGDLRRSEP